MDKITVRKIDEVWASVHSDNRGVCQELRDHFTFEVPGAEFSPKYENGVWDGKIRIYQIQTKRLYLGLIPRLISFCEARDYELEVKDDIFTLDQFSVKEAKDFIKTLPKLPFVPDDYQINSFVHCVRTRRLTNIIPTGGGKSFVLYLLAMWYANQNILLIVPTKSLVYQMADDFIEYGCDPADIHIIMGGHEKNTDKRIVISTWQSLHKESDSFFRRYGVLLGDECDMFSAKSLTGIGEKMTNTQYRFGFTGTLQDAKANRLVIEGIFGIAKVFAKTNDLIDIGRLASFKVKFLILKHSVEERKAARKFDYQNEISYLIAHKKRNRFITNLALSLDGNTLVLFERVETHGEILYNMIKEDADDKRKVFYIHGGKDAEEREEVKKITEKESNAIIAASYGTFSRGQNIKNLHNVITCYPGKAKRKNLQSLGRALRIGDRKDSAVLFDISDDLRIGKHVNISLKHLSERMKIYAEEEFDYKTYSIRI